MSYQSFGVKGDSDSEGKWKGLQLTEKHFKGKRVLDIGCNEGFFCIRATELGASRVLGIDYGESWIAKARQRCMHLKQRKPDYSVLDWKNLDSLKETFDVILLLSSFHYATEFGSDGVSTLLRAIERRLAPGGILIWEGGIIAGEGELWHEVKRAIDTRKFPTKKALERQFHSVFMGVKFIGSSVMQAGDPTPRFVYWLQKKQ